MGHIHVLVTICRGLHALLCAPPKYQTQKQTKRISLLLLLLHFRHLGNREGEPGEISFPLLEAQGGACGWTVVPTTPRLSPH